MSHGLAASVGAICILLCVSAPRATASVQQPTAVLQVVVRSDTGPIPRAQVILDGKTMETDASGR